MDNDATSTLTGTSAEDQAAINELLGGGAASEEETTSETEQKPGTHTEEEKAPPAKESEEAEEADRGTEEDDEPAEKTEDEPEEEESELSIEDSDRDYSQAAYEKAAKHYSKTLGVQLDPNDPAHRALLKENMDRGEALKRLNAERDEKAKTEEEKPAAEEEKPVELPKPTPEQIQNSLQEIRAVAQSRLVPEVAMHFATDLKTALAELLWEDEAPEKITAPTQARANKAMVALHSLMLAALNDAAQPLLQMVNNGLAADPVWGPARQEAIDARAFEHIDKTKGAEFYASLEALAEDGTLKKVIAENPEVFRNIRAGNGRDPVLNRAAQLETAFKIARGDKTIQQVTKAVETGKKQATTIAKKIAAGRVSAGTPKSGFKPGETAADKLVSSLTTGGGSKFSAAVKSQLHR